MASGLYTSVVENDRKRDALKNKKPGDTKEDLAEGERRAAKRAEQAKANEPAPAAKAIVAAAKDALTAPAGPKSAAATVGTGVGRGPKPGSAAPAMPGSAAVTRPTTVVGQQTGAGRGPRPSTIPHSVENAVKAKPPAVGRLTTVAPQTGAGRGPRPGTIPMAPTSSSASKGQGPKPASASNPTATLTPAKPTGAPANKDRPPATATKASGGKAKSGFGAAFAAARKSGSKEFTFNGKKYNTKLKGEGGGNGAAKPKSAGEASNKPMPGQTYGAPKQLHPDRPKSVGAYRGKGYTPHRPGITIRQQRDRRK